MICQLCSNLGVDVAQLKDRIARLEHLVVEKFAESLALSMKMVQCLKEITNKVSKKQVMVYFTMKVEEIYFDHASFLPDVRQQLKINGLEELKELHKAKLSSSAKRWLHVSLTPMVHHFLLFIHVY